MKIFTKATSNGMELDGYSKLTMTYTADGFNELMHDIDKNGQLVPIILREGNILDGRHRYQACKDLGLDVRCVETGIISDEEALGTVISNSINKATNTDAAKVEAYLMCKARDLKQKDMPTMFSRLNTDYIRKLAYIERENPEYLQALLRQNSVRLYNKEFEKAEDYGTIHGIWRTVKSNQKLNGKISEVIPEPASDSDYETDMEAYFDNAAAESEYWDLFDLAKNDGVNMHPDSALGKRVAKLVKYKYS